MNKQSDADVTLPDCDEGDLQWIDKKDIFALNLWPGDRIFLQLIMNPDQPFFSLKLVYKGDDLVSAKLDGRLMDNYL